VQPLGADSKNYERPLDSNQCVVEKHQACCRDRDQRSQVGYWRQVERTASKVQKQDER